MATARASRGSRLGHRSGSPAPRSRISSEENSPMLGNSSSLASASELLSERRYDASSSPSSDALASALRYPTLRSERPGNPSGLDRREGPGKAWRISPRTSTGSPSSSAILAFTLAACTIRIRLPMIAQAVVSNIFNPKIAVFFLAYLPQFADPLATDDLGPQLLVLGLAFALMTWATFSVVAHFSGSLGAWLRSRPRAAKMVSWLTGGVLMSLGLRLALSQRR